MPFNPAARPSRAETMRPPVHSAIGCRKFSQNHVPSGANAASTLFSTRKAPERTSRNAGSASSAVHAASGTKRL